MSTATRAKTIQIFLPAGDPRGIRVAEITTRIVQVIEVPRLLLDDFLKMPESGQVALYFLFGQTEGGENPSVYIGQTGDLRERLATHHKKKDFWQRALVLVSRTNSLTQTHALFLEWMCIQEAKKVGRYAAENGNGGTKPHTPAPLEADCLEIYETGRTLLATLGYPLFEPLVPAAGSPEASELFYCKRAGTNARGEYTAEGFVVLKGSTGRAEVSKAFQNHSFAKHRAELIAAGKLAIEGSTVVFKENVLFQSPSGASAVVCGAASNGWREWKNDLGITLDEAKRHTTPTETSE
jgi:predicted GIY-YIG superfamily endonuclease